MSTGLLAWRVTACRAPDVDWNHGRCHNATPKGGPPSRPERQARDPLAIAFEGEDLLAARRIPQLIVLSALPMTIRFPSVLNVAILTALVCPGKGETASRSSRRTPASCSSCTRFSISTTMESISPEVAAPRGSCFRVVQLLLVVQVVQR
jgi:hypothetical protein